MANWIQRFSTIIVERLRGGAPLLHLQCLREVRYASSSFDDGVTGELLLFAGGSTLYQVSLASDVRDQSN